MQELTVSSAFVEYEACLHIKGCGMRVALLALCKFQECLARDGGFDAM